MDDTRLGSSGLKISRITPGCLSFGDGSRIPWAAGRRAGGVDPLIITSFGKREL